MRSLTVSPPVRLSERALGEPDMADNKREIADARATLRLLKKYDDPVIIRVS
jgi:hypothetical protein